jgi:hypothetical protein
MDSAGSVGRLVGRRLGNLRMRSREVSKSEGRIANMSVLWWSWLDTSASEKMSTKGEMAIGQLKVIFRGKSSAYRANSDREDCLGGARTCCAVGGRAARTPTRSGPPSHAASFLCLDSGPKLDVKRRAAMHTYPGRHPCRRCCTATTATAWPGIGCRRPTSVADGVAEMVGLSCVNCEMELSVR